MNLSVSLPESDVEVLDRYAGARGLPSRSAAIQEAVDRLRDTLLREDYKASFQEWAANPANAVWDASVGDGLSDETW
ncbi:MAG: ribbon-helix-helix protein, CopG family [Bifidobacteriaceae bacterium]|jgi:Arc/MetJ-type ribon-helix-helix transcriptional regulator|nr:ribbon-helix-helix protein, CopG family [Bifidobacteriaceae bacterium]